MSRSVRPDSPRRSRRPASLVAERAVRYLLQHGGRASSRKLAGEVLATRTGDEAAARRILEAAFARDPRLVYRDNAWRVSGDARPARPAVSAPQDRTLLWIQAEPDARGRPGRLESVAAVRLQELAVVSACGGRTLPDRNGGELRSQVLVLLDGAVPVLHTSRAAQRLFERWLGEPLEAPVQLRELARQRLGLPAAHTLEDLAGCLGLGWTESDDPLDQAELLDLCLETLKQPEESLEDLQRALYAELEPVAWDRYGFDRAFLRSLPGVPGIYRFLDRRGRVLYVGRSRNLARRLRSYFLPHQRRSSRIRALLADLHRIEVEPLYSDLEAVLEEAAQIAAQHPPGNRQRTVHPSSRARTSVGTVLILEPARPPHVLRAFFLHDGMLAARVAIGPRGGGLRKLERLLDRHAFDLSGGAPSHPGTPVETELVTRWLARHRDRVVAFDPTELKSASEVVRRLRWIIESGALRDPDGAPIHLR